MKIADKLSGTMEYEVLYRMHIIYGKIAQRQYAWKKASGLLCPDGCGTCCENFEPDILESESLYLAAWMLENKPQLAADLINGTFISFQPQNNKGCILYDPNNPQHCSAYGGRCLICRLFGYSGDYGKDTKKRWKPCKFIPDELLVQNNPPLRHKQYDAEEMLTLFGITPPAMSDLMEQVLGIIPDKATKTYPLRESLQESIKKIIFLISFNNNNEPNAA